MNVSRLKAPLRNACLKFRNQIASGSSLTAFLDRYEIDVVLDVGANIGQYSRNLIRKGYRGRIVSFEPLPDAFDRLRQSRWGMSNWTIHPYALGAEDHLATLNVAGNSMSSSLHEMRPEHVVAAPESAYVSSVDVQVKRLDSVFDELVVDGECCWMKLDVQGHEHEVLRGATESLSRIIAVEAELSLHPLYEGQLLWQDSIQLMNDLGYEMVDLVPGFRDKATGMMMQADGIFVQRKAIEMLRRVA